MSYNKNLIIVFDTETTGFNPVKNEIVQLSYILYDISKQEVVYATKPEEDIVNIKGNIPKQTSDIHGITKDMTINKRPIKEHIDEFIGYCNQAGKFVGHNIKFDIKMITGQIQKIIQEFPDTVEIYKTFLERFQMIGNSLPEGAYCTMMESQGICAQIRGTNKLKWEKLMEVHKLLFNQDVGGQLHNALVDISVTLRVYLKLTMDIDICLSMTEFNRDITAVTNNYSICSLINPIQISIQKENINYSGELITGLNIIPGGIEEEKITVQTIAENFVSEVQKQAMSNVMAKVTPMCTNISICKVIIKSGKRSGQECGRPAKINNEFCGIYHRPRGTKVKPVNENLIVESSIREKPTTSFVSNLFTKKNKVVPEGGRKRRKTSRLTKKTRYTKKRRSYKNLLRNK